MMSRKNITLTGGFKPFPFTLKKDRKGGFDITSDPIDWESLTKHEQQLQWTVCLNSLWFYENEGLISKAMLEPFFYHYLDVHFPSDIAPVVRSLPDWRVSYSLMCTTFLLVCGAKNEGSEEYVRETVGNLTAIAQPKYEIVVETKSLPPSVDKRKSTILGMIEEMEDLMKSPLSLEDFLERQKPTASIIDEIQVYYGRRMLELYSVIENDDEQLVEGYRNWTKQKIEQQIAWYSELFDVLAKFAEKKPPPPSNTIRKARSKKPINPKKVVSKLKYLREFPELGLKSIDPTKILDSSMLLGYDTRKRKLCVYVGTNMSIKGTTLASWDPTLSGSKTLRKPEEQIKRFVGVNKAAVTVAWNEIKSKPQPVNGRINKDMILIRAY